MPVLRHKVTGAVVSCSDATAARLGAAWGPVDQKKSAARKRTTKKKAE